MTYKTKKYYERNKQYYKDKAAKRKAKLRVFVNEIKANSECMVCGENHPACLDFHHRDPTKKDIAVSRATSEGYSKKRIMAEIEKCDILCSNCHKKLHASMV